MERIAISRFKATCLALLHRVSKTRKPILVTKFGRPVAQVVPPPAEPARGAWLGAMRGTGSVAGDLTEPVSGSDWEALRS